MDVINQIEGDLIAHLKQVNQTIFDNRLTTVESYDEQLTSENIQSGAILGTPAILVMYTGCDDREEINNDVYAVSHKFAIICVSDNAAGDTAKTRETYWLVNQARKAFRGATIELVEANDVKRKFPIFMTGVIPEIRGKSLNVFTLLLSVEIKEGEDDD